VHSLLLRRLRQLESRVVHAEAARSEAEAASKSLSARLEGAQDVISDQAALIGRLDDALSSRLVVSGLAPTVSTAPAHVPRGEGVSATPVAMRSSPSAVSPGSLLSPKLQLESLFGTATAGDARSVAAGRLPSSASDGPSALATGITDISASGELLYILQVRT
jgi:hypothetical protein